MLKLKISHGDKKMKGFDSINTNSLTNDFCNKMKKNCNMVCNKCYSNQFLSYRKNAKIAYQKNTDILANNILEFKDIDYINSKYFRFHSFGELINFTHLKNFITIAEKNKHVSFGLWTKRKDIINKYHDLIPDNIILIYSNPYLNKPILKVPDNFDKVFNVITIEYMLEKCIKVNCFKACINCLNCYKKSNKLDNNIVIELLKKDKPKYNKLKGIFNYDNL